MNPNDITIDSIFDDRTFLVQNRNGYRFSVDSLLLSWYVHESIGKRHSVKRALEIGAGNGVISITLKRRGFQSPVECVEVQDSLFSILESNVERNDLLGEIIPLRGNFLDMPLSFEQYDVLFTNPPYFPVNNGRLNPNSEKAQARHELHGNLKDFFRKGVKLLKKKGLFFLIYPLNKLQQALFFSQQHKLYLKDLVLVRENEQSDPSLFLASFVKGLGESTQSSGKVIVMKDSSGNYTETGRRVMYDLS